jgi:hypothetical protein
MKFDPDLAHGPRAPLPTPGVGAAASMEEISKLGHMLLRKVGFTLLPGEEKDACMIALDQAISYAKTLVARHDRNGPKVGNTELEDMQSTLRLAAKNPDQFKAFDVKGLKAAVDKLTQPEKKK